MSKPLAASPADIFAQALVDTNRSARDRFAKATGLPREDYDARDFLAPVKPLAETALPAARGPEYTAASIFPFTLWTGGRYHVEGGISVPDRPASDFLSLLRELAEQTAEKGKGIVFQPTTNTDGQRTNASTLVMHAVTLDCDGTGSWDALLAHLNTLGLAHFAYQSGGHREGTPKWRVILPLAKPFAVDSDERKANWKTAYNAARVIIGALAGLSGAGFDPACETPAHPWFATERRSPDDPERLSIFTPGASLDLDALLASLPPPPIEAPAEPRTFAPSALIEASAERLEQIIAGIVPAVEQIPEGRRILYQALSGALLDRGLSAEAMLAVVEEVSRRCPGLQDRHGEHVHGARTTVTRRDKGQSYYGAGVLGESWPGVAAAVDAVLPDSAKRGMDLFFAEWKARRAGRVAAYIEAAEAPTQAIPGASVREGDDAPTRPDALVGSLRYTARSKQKHENVETAIDALFLARFLDGEPLIDAVEDPASLVEVGIGDALGRLLKLLAWSVPLSTPWATLQALGWKSLRRSGCDGDDFDKLSELYSEEVARRVEWQREKIDKARRDRLDMTRDVLGGRDVFSVDDLDAIAASQRCATSDLRKRWIIQYGKSYYVLGAKGEYKSPITYDALATSLPRDLVLVPDSTVSPAGIDWFRLDAKGNPVPKTVPQLLADYSTVARSGVADTSIAFGFYDPRTETYFEATCPQVEVEPVFHADIDLWLRKLGGRKADDLLDWIATAFRQDTLKLPTSALVLTGPRSSGKELFVQGAARLWGCSSPTELSRVVENFNEDLARCPLVVADEHLPTAKGKRTTLTDLRSIIASSSRTLSRKFISNTSLVGAIRLVLTANNENIMGSPDDLSPDDQKAVAVRFLHVALDDEPAAYLASIGGRATTEAWVEGGMFAEHVRWLEANRVVARGNRFLVEGSADDMNVHLVVNNKVTNLVLEWLVKTLDELPPSGVLPVTGLPLIIAGNGEVLVNIRAISGVAWEKHVKSDRLPSTKLLGTAVSRIALGKRVVHYGPRDERKQVSYWSIAPKFLAEWIDRIGLMSADRLRDTLARPVDLAAFGSDAPASPAKVLPFKGPNTPAAE